MQTKKLKNSDFVHLHNHTQYSLLDGLTKIPELMEYVRKENMHSVAITDHGTLSGLIEFYKEAKIHEVKPILGMEAYIASRSLKDKEVGKDKNNYHLIILAKNNKGYSNLMKLSTISNLEGFYYKPRIDRETLQKYSEGLIILSGCMGSELGSALLENNDDEAQNIIKWYKDVFKEDYYLEIQDHGHPDHPTFNQDQERVNQQIFELAKQYSLPVVVTSDSHYLRKEDKLAHEVLLCVQTNSYLSQTNRFSMQDLDLYVTPPKDLIKRWGTTHPEVITNTSKIASQVEVTIKLGEILIPKFDTPKKMSENEFLINQVYLGLQSRYLNNTKPNTTQQIKELLDPILVERTEYELDIIQKMKFSGYFLIVSDLINWGKNQGIIFGPGRGSAAGSIVSYALNITEIDPIKFNLMFERFLNPSRVSMPDIDIDIQDSRREEVINYCVNKYGINRVANIVTFGKMAARNAVRDVARVLEVPYADADKLAKMLPLPIQGRHIPLKITLKEDSTLKQEYKTNPVSKKILDLAKQLEGTIRSHGVHAAGVVIAPTDITEHVPLEIAQKGAVTTQYPMGPIDELGLLKIDFLGLSNLTIINNTLRIIKRVYNKKINILEIPFDDPKTFELLSNAKTTGVFQLESAGMKRYLKELKPTVFSDIIAMVALYRPGPMSEIPKFIKGKNDSNAISYPHKALEPILKDTYGVMVYQEQITQILQLVAGYSAGEADLVRKAIGKKNRNIMANEEPKFIDGCLKQGLTKKSAEELWSLIQPFADYSFNKAHATCYGQIAYTTAYLKANYPMAYMSALMTSDYDNSDRLAIEIGECQSLGIQVLPPSINKSFVEFGVDIKDNQIRFGLNAIKNVGRAAAEEIVETRGDTPYQNLEDYLTRINSRIVNKKALESLIKVGAFDDFYDRTDLLSEIELLLSYASQKNKQKNTDQMDMFTGLDNGNKDLIISNKLDLNLKPHSNDTKEYLSWERTLLGIYLSSHPLDQYREQLAQYQVTYQAIKESRADKVHKLGGIINSVNQILTKKNQKMAFIKFETLDHEYEVVIFPKIFDNYQKLLEVDRVVLMNLKKSSSNRQLSDELSLIADSISDISNSVDILTQHDLSGPGAKQFIESDKEERIFIRIREIDDHQLLIKLKQEMLKNSGSTPIVIVYNELNDKQAIRLPGGFNYVDQNSLDILRELVGQDNIRIS